METAIAWVVQHGYAGIFFALMLGIVGLPIPDETVLVFTGYLISQDRLAALPSLVCALLGSVCGITVSYAIGRTFGLYLVQTFGRYVHVSHERLNRAHRWFQRMGRWSLALGYYVPGVRHLTAYVAGAAGLEFPTFALFAYSGGLIWSVTFIAIGYVGGRGWA
jgi:membrane protein DedA with SNARE-associated domain